MINVTFNYERYLINCLLIGIILSSVTCVAIAIGSVIAQPNRDGAPKDRLKNGTNV